MMGGLRRNWSTRSLVKLSFIICLCRCIQSVRAQPGFLSIECCSDANYNDNLTAINWVSDKFWYPNYQDCAILRTGQDHQDYNRKRIFNSDVGNKWCYNLTTHKDQDYLVRATFLSGDQEKNPALSVFNVSIDATVIAQVNSDDSKIEVEGIFRATRDYVNFCLLKVQGAPHISKLELRPLTTDYLDRVPSSALNLIKRVDAGNKGDVRYPVDEYDRIWAADTYADPTVNFISSHNINITSSSYNNISFPPNQVLQTALTHPEKLQFLYDQLDPVYYRYDIILYFLELNESVKARERVFDIYINSINKSQVDIVGSGSSVLVVALNVTANGKLDLTMVKSPNGSKLGPILSAFEIMRAHPLNQETSQEEVGIMMDVKNELLEHNQDNEFLLSWSGDPCLPISWPGLVCQQVNGTSLVTNMNLSFRNLGGPVPHSITKLIHLEELDLRHNNLIGDVSEILASLPNLTSLYFGCNPNLHNGLPDSLNRTDLSTDYGKCTGHASRHSLQKVKIGVVAGVCTLGIIAAGVFLFCRKKRKVVFLSKFDGNEYPVTKNAIYSIPSTEIVRKSISVKAFSLDYIELATQKYKTLIGEGGFGSVYRGTLSDGEEVAVKVRSATSTQGTREFDNELNLLSAIRHENLVPLLGYCSEKDQQILVYPFMSNGSLQDRLYGEASKRKALDWPTRLSIALGSARGLAYLHTFPGRSVIHRDVKSSNILLDQSMNAKVADFGFSKYAPQEGDSTTSLEVRGTAGYLDPEYYSTQHLSAKSDVFSFGVVLLEIVTGREPLNINRPRNEWSLVEWAKPRIRNSRMDEIVDPNIKGGYHAEAMWRVVEVALACIEPYSAYRPCMADIVRELEDALIIENNASEYLKSIDSFGGSHRYSIERPIVILPTPVQTETSPILSQPPPPQPR
ncbi:OLC1v1010612C1 [Oldenlandia corymbosa var. corymbosa]|uniref:OLC1v1010612C1 n=1 Tax=Oldenlandia corymbosa var. corymbosa TaxID=529605 RepID=A0AAV1DRR6_OLDCO|nr:OLC1v1010612C1 [Oldenlandia corymbosa var. corymbosa]